MNAAIARSYLFVPANRPDRFAKALSSGAHEVIIDLEDAVPSDEKLAVRAGVAAALNPDRPVLLRINGSDTEWFRGDLELCRLPGVAGVILPKAERIDDIFLVECSSVAKAVYPLIETARGMANARVLAEARGVQRLMFGTIDFKLDTGIEGDDEELLFFRSQLVMVSRVAGILPPVDGVTTEIDNVEQVRKESARARRFGFGGKFCIHPKQVAEVNQCFLPSDEEREWAKRVLEHAAASNGAAIAMDGKMIDRPVIQKAQQILEEAMRQALASTSAKEKS